METSTIDKLSKLPTHQIIKQISLSEFLRQFDAVSLYPSAIWDEKSIFPRIETGYAYTKDMIIDLFNKFDNQPLARGSAILKIMYYNPKDLIVQHLPNEGEVNRIK